MNTNNANDFLNIISFSLPKKKKCYELMFVWASKLSVHTTFLKCSLGYCDMKWIECSRWLPLSARHRRRSLTMGRKECVEYEGFWNWNCGVRIKSNREHSGIALCVWIHIIFPLVGRYGVLLPMLDHPTDTDASLNQTTEQNQKYGNIMNSLKNHEQVTCNNFTIIT